MTAVQVVIGQGLGWGAGAAVPMLPSPPAAHYVLEDPWPIVIGCVVLLTILAWLAVSGRLDGRRWVRPAGLGLILIALGVALASTLVKTDREELAERTAVLVEAAAKGDTAALTSMLSSSVTLRVLEGQTRYSREQIMDLVRKYPGSTPIDWYKIDKVAAAMDGRDMGRSQAHVRVRSKQTTMYDVPIGSWWLIEWQRSPGGNGAWKVIGLECQQIDGVEGNVRP
ncbi:MAG: hypothetical protein IT438_05900 [Phycisphaerales bacterium]|nr:hypothetical protein [Phycisphaerales bacterium]